MRNSLQLADALEKRVYVSHVEGDQSANTIHSHLVDALPDFEKESFRVDIGQDSFNRQSSFF